MAWNGKGNNAHDKGGGVFFPTEASSSMEAKGYGKGYDNKGYYNKDYDNGKGKNGYDKGKGKNGYDNGYGYGKDNRDHGDHQHGAKRWGGSEVRLSPPPPPPTTTSPPGFLNLNSIVEILRARGMTFSKVPDFFKMSCKTLCERIRLMKQNLIK